MHTRPLLRRALVAVVASLAGSAVVPLATASPAAAEPPAGYTDLVAIGSLYNLSQTDRRWAPLPIAGGPIGRCGCQLTALASMVGLYTGAPAARNLPRVGLAEALFPSTIVDLSVKEYFPWEKTVVVTTHEVPIFSPYYLHRVLEGNGGYDNDGCGSGVQPWSLSHIAIPKQLETGDGNIKIGPKGMYVEYLDGFDRSRVDSNLAQGRPTIVGRAIVNEATGETRHHVNIVTGYDPSVGRYLYVDPLAPTGVLFSAQGSEHWENEVITTIDTYPVAAANDHMYLRPAGSPAPGIQAAAANAATVDVELGAVLADGTLVGYDPATGEHHQTRGNLDWDEFDASLDEAPAAPRRTAGLMTTGHGAGTIRTRIVANATGEYAVELRTIVQDGLADNLLMTARGTAAAGEEIKHEVTYAEDGSATVVEVDDFSPEVVVDAIEGVAGEAVVLDASGSFDADGTIASVAWAFGDGATGTGPSPSHTWARPGTYPVDVTVTSADGVARTETVTATIAPSETDAPTVTIDAGDIESGWTDADAVTVTVEADDNGGSGVESVTLDVDGVETTTPGDTASVTITEEGSTSVSALAVDRMGNVAGGQHVSVGIDRTGPTAAVTAPGPDRPVRSLSFITGTADDGAGSGVEDVEVEVRRANGSVVGGGWLPADGDDGWWLVDDRLTALPDGEYAMRVRATDVAGNVGPASAPTTVVVAADAAGGPADIVELLPTVASDAGSVATSVSDAGDPFGLLVGIGLRDRALRWSPDGTGTELAAVIASDGAHIEGVSDDGDTAAGWSISPTGQSRATAWIDGVPVDLGTVNGGRSEAHDVNDAGVAVGTSAVTSGQQRSRAAVFVDGHARFLPDLGASASTALAVNDDGVAVGFRDAGLGGSERAFLTDGSTAVDLPSSGTSTAYDINDAGVVVGVDDWQAVRWVEGEQEVLFDGAAHAVAETGAVVGSGPDGTAVRWQDGDLVDLNDLIDPAAGWVLHEARDIASDGTVIVGVGERFGATRGFRLSLVGDDAQPTTQATITPADEWTNQTVAVDLSATDGPNGTGVDRIDVTGQAPVTGASRTVVIDEEGTHELAWSAVDVAGNAEVPGTATVRIDRTAPTATLSVPSEGAWQPGPVAVDVTAEDAGGSGVEAVAVSVDGAAAPPVPPGPVAIDGDGEHVVTAVATDRAGNAGAPATATVRVDGTAPSIAFGFEGGPATPGLLAGFAASDATSGVAAVLAFVTDRNGTRPVTADVALTTPGATTLSVTAFDAAGNVASASRTVVVGEDGPTEPPAPNGVPVADPGGPYTAAARQRFTLDGRGSTDPDGDQLTYEWAVDYAPVATGPTATFALTQPGEHVVTLVVSDGQHSSTTAFTTVTVTAQAPTALAASPVVLRLQRLTVFLGTFEARLTSGTGAPVAGEPVRFEVLGRTRCTATTDANGVARCQAQLLDALLAVLAPYTARYDGDEARLPSAAQARLIR